MERSFPRLFSGSDLEVSHLPPPLVAVDVAYPHYSARLMTIVLAVAVSPHDLVPHDGTMGIQCEYYTI